MPPFRKVRSKEESQPASPTEHRLPLPQVYARVSRLNLNSIPSSPPPPPFAGARTLPCRPPCREHVQASLRRRPTHLPEEKFGEDVRFLQRRPLHDSHGPGGLSGWGGAGRGNPRKGSRLSRIGLLTLCWPPSEVRAVCTCCVLMSCHRLPPSPATSPRLCQGALLHKPALGGRPRTPPHREQLSLESRGKPLAL